MYFCSNQEIENELEYLQAVKIRCTQYLRKTAYYEKCSLTVDRRHKNPKYAIVDRKSGAAKQTYVGEPTRQVDTIRARFTVKKILKRIEKRIQWLDRTLEHYEPINPNEFRDGLPYAYQDIPLVVFDIVEIPDMSKAMKSVFSDNSYNIYPEHLIHTTVSGDKIRSKGELLLTYIMDKLGIRYEYEKAIEINGRTFAPDFILTSPDGTRTIILEYFGMMSNPEYRYKNANKIKEYIEAGFIPGETILFVFDSMDGAFNSQQIERTLCDWAGIQVAV